MCFFFETDWYCTDHIFSVHSLADGSLGYFPSLVTVHGPAINTQLYKYFFGNLSIICGIYLDAELPDHLAILFLVFGGSDMLTSVTAVPFYSPTHDVPCF